MWVVGIKHGDDDDDDGGDGGGDDVDNVDDRVEHVLCVGRWDQTWSIYSPTRARNIVHDQ